MSLYLLATIGVLFGIGFGFFVQRAGLCFAHGLGEIYIGRGKRIIRLFLVIFVITSIGFLLSSYISPSLGLKPIGQLRGYGFYNLLSGILFGVGIALNGGCILGTLRQIGEGNMLFLVVFVCFIPGLALVVYGLDPLLESGYSVQKVLLPGLLGVAAPYVTATLAASGVIWFLAIRNRKRRPV
ncbi:MAG: YeeE/YedE family protein [Phycisphaerae bacterium]|nr:YeeE/YedE family protein [Phycisphaerae bacterium]